MRGLRAILLSIVILLAVNAVILLAQPAHGQKVAERPAGVPAGADYWIFMPEGGSYPPLLLNLRTGLTGHLFLGDAGWSWRVVRTN